MRLIKWMLPMLVVMVATTSCKKPADISGEVAGIWQTEWDENIGENDVEDIRVKELLFLIPDDNSDDAGEFYHIFEGDVDFDDWEYEETVPFQLAVTGKWRVDPPNEIKLTYDIEEIEISTGKSNVSADFSSAAVDLLTGNWAGALVGGIMEADGAKEANKKIDKAIEKELLTFFKKMFRKINMDHEALTDVVVDGDNMKCEVNHGFFGREAIYDRLKNNPLENNSSSSQQGSSSTYSSHSSSSHSSNDYSNNSTNSSVSTKSSPLSVGGQWAFEGEIDNKYPIYMTFDTDTKRGEYEYTKTGSGESIDLEICSLDPSTGYLYLKEYYKGECTGEFKGYVKEGPNLDDIFTGTFTTSKGKSMPFNFTSTEVGD